MYVSCLVFGPEGYVRDDFCEACWTAKAGAVSAYSSWRGTYKPPPPPEQEVLKKETAESLLRKLMEDANETRRNAIFILAVMLERKKILTEKDVQRGEDGSITRIYEHRTTGETFVVPDPQLRLDQLEHVQQEVALMLGGGPKPVDQAPAPDGQPPAEPAAPTAQPEPAKPQAPPPEPDRAEAEEEDGEEADEEEDEYEDDDEEEEDEDDR